MGGRIQYSDEADLAEIVESLAPTSILALGPKAASVFTPYLAQHPQASMTHILGGDWTAPVLDQRFDFIFLCHVLEHLGKPQAGDLLARLREKCQYLYAKVPIGKAWLNHVSFWETSDLQALGLALVNLTAASGRPVGLFGYDCGTFKIETEWLNSQYWA